jgi:type-F conjugative transfer system pilin assembly thiol-disulfide isomerase TrbB
MKLVLVMLFSFKAAFGFENIVEAKLKHVKQVPPSQTTITQSHDFMTDHSILLVYSSRCQYCQLFAPTLKQWVDERGLSVRAISLDGIALNEFPNIEQTDEELINAAFGDMPHGTPALFIINDQSQAIYPAVLGNASYQDLNQRMTELAIKIKEFEGRA